MDLLAEFLQGVEITGHRLDKDKINAFRVYRDEIIRVNELLRLMSKNDINRIPHRHFLDSLMPALLGILPTGGTILDIGSGGGLPGIPLAIFYPETNFVLVESYGKKCVFLRQVVRVVSLDNVAVRQIRAEALKNTEPEKVYDSAVSRAVGSIDQLVEWSSGLLKPGGKLVCYKGRNPEVEIKSATKVMEERGMVLENIHQYETSESRSHSLVVLRKR